MNAPRPGTAGDAGLLHGDVEVRVAVQDRHGKRLGCRRELAGAPGGALPAGFGSLLVRHRVQDHTRAAPADTLARPADIGAAATPSSPIRWA